MFSKGFLNSIQFGPNFSAPTHQSGLQFGLSDFLTCELCRNNLMNVLIVKPSTYNHGFFFHFEEDWNSFQPSMIALAQSLKRQQD